MNTPKSRGYALKLLAFDFIHWSFIAQLQLIFSLLIWLITNNCSKLRFNLFITVRDIPSWNIAHNKTDLISSFTDMRHRDSDSTFHTFNSKLHVSDARTEESNSNVFTTIWWWRGVVTDSSDLTQNSQFMKFTMFACSLLRSYNLRDSLSTLCLDGAQLFSLFVLYESGQSVTSYNLHLLWNLDICMLL